jgi:hypothetical protein
MRKTSAVSKQDYYAVLWYPLDNNKNASAVDLIIQDQVYSRKDAPRSRCKNPHAKVYK